MSRPYWAASSLPACGQLRLDELGQGEVHVVAAQEQVVADRLAHEAQLALLLDGLDEAEVGGAAADIDDQAEIAGPELGSFLGGMRSRASSRRRPAALRAA